ncbi:MAG: lysylphosphatidylglycerol synthase domain-containing protein, partial [Lutibacter sp.]
MYNIITKYKVPLTLLIKVAIVIGSLVFIYLHITEQNVNLKSFLRLWQLTKPNKVYWIIAILLLTDANWLLEILKWKILVSTVKKITFIETYEQSLASLTVSLITPNRIGEYGAKALYYQKKLRKKIFALNAIGNGSQFLATLFFGMIGLGLINQKYRVNWQFVFPNTNLFLFVLFGLFLFVFLVITFASKYKNRVYNYINSIPKIIFGKCIGLSFSRYIIFSHQFYLILIFFNSNISYFEAISLIFSLYFLASIVPSFALFDWAVKGSFAIWLFQLADVAPIFIFTVIL